MGKARADTRSWVVALALAAGSGCGARAHASLCEGDPPPGASSGPPECEFQCNDPAAPAFRLSSLGFTEPRQLANASMDAAVTASIESLRMVWLLDADADGSLTIGSGECDPSWRCRLLSTPEPARTTWDHDPATGELRSGATPQIDLRFVVDLGPGGNFDGPVRLREVRLEGRTSHDANCIGSRLDSSVWDMGGLLHAKLTARDAGDARSTSSGGPSLCDVVASGMMGTLGYCVDTPPGDWTVQTDADVDGEPAWNVTAYFAATGILLEPSEGGP